MSAFLPTVGQLARVVAGPVNLVAVVERLDDRSVVLDVHGSALPAGPARLSFNCAFGGVLLMGQLRVDGHETSFSPSEKGARFAQRRETFRVAAALPATIARRGRRSIACTTLNLSIGGALLETERPLAHPGPLTVTIECGDGQTMSLAASVARSEHGAMGVAIAFTNVSGADERRLSTLIAAAQRRALVSR
ncbi:MAG TPA: PilZ domain-containing protein [Solirubrobacteraceae bacterium]|nr:PilZ domain-containing protein [Solirubrobacteraceae bacterium]